MATIFISHSTKDAEAAPGPDAGAEAHARYRRLEFARELRRRLEVALAGQFEVWLDKRRLEAGDPWREGIHEGLGSCDGAVLLLSPEALESGWVLKEATILTWRFFLGSPVRIVPIFLDGVGPADLVANGFGPVGVDEIQAVQASSGDDLGPVVADVVGKFHGLGHGEDDLEIQYWIEDVEANLGDSENHHKRMFQALGLSNSDWSQFNARRRTIARALLLAEPAKIEASLHQVANAIKGPKYDTLAALVEPSWVQANAAKNLLRVSAKEEQRRIAAIDGTAQETGRDYVNRAFCGNLENYRIVTIGGRSGGPAADVVEKYEEALSNYFDLKKLGESVTPTKPVFVVLHEETARPDVVALMVSRYPSLTYVLLPGERLPELLAQVQEMELLEPEMQDEDAGRRFRNRIADLA